MNFLGVKTDESLQSESTWPRKFVTRCRYGMSVSWTATFYSPVYSCYILLL